MTENGDRLQKVQYSMVTIIKRKKSKEYIWEWQRNADDDDDKDDVIIYSYTARECGQVVKWTFR